MAVSTARGDQGTLTLITVELTEPATVAVEVAIVFVAAGITIIAIGAKRIEIVL